MAIAAQKLAKPGRIRLEWQLCDWCVALKLGMDVPYCVALGAGPVTLVHLPLWSVTAVCVKIHFSLQTIIALYVSSDARSEPKGDLKLNYITV